MRVLAVDPGPTPGLAVWESSTEEFRAWIEPGWFEGVDAVNNWTAGHDVDIVVYETFAITGRQGRGKPSNETVQMIGALRWICGRHGVQFVGQAPADAKGFSTNDKLKKLGWKTPSSPDHARSAARHLLLYLARQHLIDSASLLS